MPLKKQVVYVAVDIDRGWDNVIGAFDSMPKARAACLPKGDEWNDERYTDRICDRTGIYNMHHIHTVEVQ